MARAIKPSLRKGRPPLLDNSTLQSTHGASVNARRKSAKATRTLINRHHQLQKRRQAAISSGDTDSLKAFDDEIERLGGLSAYQAASLTGQDKDRGGDSSIKLVEWLRKHGVLQVSAITSSEGAYRVLEVGALSSDNAISLAVGNGIQTVKRIDLHSQDPKTIEEIDFMDLPIDSNEDEKFDVLSLSLVLNYVPEPSQRGAMLRRTTQVLRQKINQTAKVQQKVQEPEVSSEEALPCLFIVLPLPCMENSRYMTHQHFILLMRSIGYDMLEHHDSQKLCYMLFKLNLQANLGSPSARPTFKKIELRSGKSRNNFAVVLEPE